MMFIAPRTKAIENGLNWTIFMIIDYVKMTDFEYFWSEDGE